MWRGSMTKWALTEISRNGSTFGQTWKLFKICSTFPASLINRAPFSSNCAHLFPSLSSMFLSPEFVRRSSEGNWVAAPLYQGHTEPLLSDPLSIPPFSPRREGQAGGSSQLRCGCWRCLRFPFLTCPSAAFFPLCTVHWGGEDQSYSQEHVIKWLFYHLMNFTRSQK